MSEPSFVQHWPDFDVARARRETPGCCPELAHFNHAGASLLPGAVHQRVRAYLDEELLLGGYEVARRQTQERQQVYADAAKLIGASPDEIALTDSATRAFNTALWSLDLPPGSRIAVSRVAYGSNALALLELCRRTGVELVVLPSADDGTVDLTGLREELDRGLSLVALTHIPTNGGLVNPAEAVGAMCRQAGVTYLLDACQSLGQRVVDVDRVGCDLLSGTSRKYLRGPRGQGLLYVRRSLLDRLRPPFPDVGSADWSTATHWEPAAGARRLESWEHDVAGRLGFGVALRYAHAWGLQTIQDRVQAVAHTLRELLDEVSGITVTDQGSERSGLVTFLKHDVPASVIRQRLAAGGIHTSVSAAASTRLDMDERGLTEIVRASVHYTTTGSELLRLQRALQAW